MADVIPLIVPEIRGNEWKYVKECLGYELGLFSRQLR